MHPNARASALAVQQDIRATTARSWVLGLTAAAQFVLQLDFSIVNVALPTVQRELSFSASGLQWVVTGYALTYGALLLVAGRGGDQIGHRRAMLAGLTLFAISSLAGGLAVSAPMLVIARLVQGGSAALIAPAALALLVDAYQSPAARARALGIFQGSTAAGATAGIVLGGVLTEYLGWRSVLLVNPPVIAILVAIMLRRLPARDMDETRDSAVGAGAARRLDVAGAGLITAAIAALIFGLSEGQSRGFGNPEAIATLAAAVVLGVAFVFVGVAAVAGQLTRTSRGANTLASVVLAVAYRQGDSSRERSPDEAGTRRPVQRSTRRRLRRRQRHGLGALLGRH